MDKFFEEEEEEPLRWREIRKPSINDTKDVKGETEELPPPNNGLYNQINFKTRRAERPVTNLEVSIEAEKFLRQREEQKRLIDKIKSAKIGTEEFKGCRYTTTGNPISFGDSINSDGFNNYISDTGTAGFQTIKGWDPIFPPMEEEKIEKIPIVKTEEIYINYNELSDELAKNELIQKYGKEYSEVDTADEWVELCEKYKILIFKHERDEK